MTEIELLKIESGFSETKIQHICVEWFRQTFPTVANLLFAIPNGGTRSKKSASMRKYEGAVAGVSDLILLFPSGGKSALCIEMKKPKQKGRSAGTQSTEQKKWQALVTTYGGVYGICHRLCEFIRLVCSYLKANPAPYIEQALKQFPNYL